MANPVVVVTGVGPGTGAAIARRFSRGGYAVAMLARTRERLAALEREIERARGYPCDVTDEAELDRTLGAVRADLGVPRVLVHNAVGGAFGNFLDIDPEVLNRNFQVNTMALLHLARRLAPAMVAAGEGAIITTGNTSAIRGKASFAGFAPTQAAQRILAESIAREVGPKGVHVAYMMVDAADVSERPGRVLHQARGDRRGSLARRASGPLRLVVQRRAQALSRDLVNGVAHEQTTDLLLPAESPDLESDRCRASVRRRGRGERQLAEGAPVVAVGLRRPAAGERRARDVGGRARWQGRLPGGQPSQDRRLHGGASVRHRAGRLQPGRQDRHLRIE